MPPSLDPENASRRSGCLVAFLLVLGLVMLLPGLCSVLMLFTMPGDVFRDGGLLLLCLVCLACGVGGVVLIAHARGRSGRPSPEN